VWGVGWKISEDEQEVRSDYPDAGDNGQATIATRAHRGDVVVNGKQRSFLRWWLTRITCLFRGISFCLALHHMFSLPAV
jgi:hypothetical protein